MEILQVYRLAVPTDPAYIRNAIPRQTPADWAISAFPVSVEGWHALFGKTCSLDWMPNGPGWPRISYAHGVENGIAINSLLGYGAVTQPFLIISAAGDTWRVLDVARDFNKCMYVKLEYLGRQDVRQVA